ncbi:MAG: PPP4R2-domain-containing protein [Monoraphidium minutum]|nr:MAG: PPP4R2-domain-containing protein [Monoraphidium minutum]
MGSDDAAGPRIAGAADLEAFISCPEERREVTEPLRGLVAEMALTGVIRYHWQLVRPLLEHLLEQQLRRFDESCGVEVGPARPVLRDGEALDPLIARLRSYLAGFDAAPWTAQRLAELLLEPGKQYRQLHKLALALEKLLLVSSGLPPALDPPPPPLLSSLRPVNETPPRAAPAAGGGGAVGGGGAKRPREDGDTGMGLVSATLGVRSDAAAAAGAGAEPAGGGSDDAGAADGGGGDGGGGGSLDGDAKRSRTGEAGAGAGGAAAGEGAGSGAAEAAAAAEPMQDDAPGGGEGAQQQQQQPQPQPGESGGAGEAPAAPAADAGEAAAAAEAAGGATPAAAAVRWTAASAAAPPARRLLQARPAVAPRPAPLPRSAAAGAGAAGTEDAAIAAAEAAEASVAAALDFLRKNVDGKTFCSGPTARKEQGGALEIETSHESTFTLANVRANAGFDLIIDAVVQQSAWTLRDGKRAGPPQIADCSLREHCQFTLRAATGGLAGLCFNARRGAPPGADPEPEAALGTSFSPTAAYGMRLSPGGAGGGGSSLSWSERPATPYIDLPGAGGRVGRFEVTSTFSLPAGGGAAGVSLSDAAEFSDYNPESGVFGPPAPRPREAWRRCAAGGLKPRANAAARPPGAGDAWPPAAASGVFGFLKAHVDGQTLELGQAGGGGGAAARRLSVKYSGLSKTYDGFAFVMDMHSAEAPAAGAAGGGIKRRLKCQYGVRATGSAQGVCWPLRAGAGTAAPPPLAPYASVMRLGGDGKVLTEAAMTLFPYEDFVPRGTGAGALGSPSPGYQERVHTMTVQRDGSLAHGMSPLATYRVDPSPPYARTPDATLRPSLAAALLL